MLLLSREMNRLLEEEAPGPHPSFTLVHALYALFILHDHHIGRQKLAATLYIGEGSARTLLRKLERRGFVSAGRAGCRLTTRGESLYGEARMAFYLFEPRRGSLLGRVSYGVGVRGGGSLAKGVRERDEAIKAGADGAMTLVYRGKELQMPGLENVSREHPELANDILHGVEPKDGDALIISWGKSVSGVIYGSLAAAWSVYERMSSGG